MKKYTLTIIAIITPILLCTFLIGSFEIIKYNKTGLCLKTGKKITDDEMRIKVIRNLISIEMKTNKWYESYDMESKLILIDKNLTELEIIKSIKSSSLLDFTKNHPIEINNQEYIDSISKTLLQNKFTIINYSIQGSWFSIFPGDEIIKSSNQELNDFLLKRKKFKYSFYEKIMGFGNHLYKIKTYDPNPSCCDDRPHSLSKEWYIEDNLKTIQFISNQLGQRYLAVSNCGDIMIRYYDSHDDGHQFYTF